MQYSKPGYFIIVAALFLTAFLFVDLTGGSSKPPYRETWESLTQHPTPEWFRDAKFGVYFHWGVYAVPAFANEWYPRNMYRRENLLFKYHRETWGPQDQFGYKDFIPMFKAEHFNADEWADLFVRAGAKFAGPVAEHHDGFAMWNSALTEWDARDMGPHRDLVGELEEAIKKRGLKFMVSFHHAYNWRFYEPAYEFDAKDPRYAGLYSTPHQPGEPESKAFLETWLGKIIEVIDAYEPDYIWFDFGWGQPAFEPYKRRFLAYYYNKAAAWGKEVVVSYKGDHLPPGAGVLDLERGRLDSLREEPWLTDTSIDRKSWCHIVNPDYKSVNEMIDNMVDRTSKNGLTLMNIAPRADGTIPEEQRQRLLAIGDWLRINGEAIYGTRPWITFGEGPTKIKGGSFIDNKGIFYTAEDIRFTTRGNALYAIVLGWPGESLLIRSLRGVRQTIASVTLLGDDEPLSWETGDEGLNIELPASKPCRHAFAFKIVFAKNPPQ